jgi:hypothetical protein
MGIGCEMSKHLATVPLLVITSIQFAMVEWSLSLLVLKGTGTVHVCNFLVFDVYK